ncbi:MAG: restriction endonuclease subunit S [Algoriphagus sp.]|nr:restriction endonuclease subunit S [Algoriphagus sp.]
MKNWGRKKIVEISTDFEDGDWIESKDQSEEGIRLIQTGNVGNGFFKDRGEKARYISEDTFKRLRCTEIFEGDCLVSRLPDPVGRACVLPNTGEKMITAVDCTIVRFDRKQLIPNWFLYYSLSNDYQKEIQKQVTGATRQRISRKNLGLVSVPLPPLPEQQRIVSILDEAFAAIAKAKANAEKNLQNAKELFESYLQGVFENGDWEKIEFGEIITVLTDYHANGSYQILKQYVELKETEDFAWMVRSTDFENNFENEFRFIDENAYNFLSKSKVFGGEIIMSKIGNAGNVYLMPRIDRPCSLAMNLFLIRLNEKKASTEFVFQYLKSYSGEFQIKSRLQGATTKTITKDNVRSIIIPLPKLKEQQTIVRQLDALRAETQKLEVLYEKKITDLEELKKSILQKAFAGELIGREVGV